ncbi:lipocalin family protein [Aquimarina sp. ERC-38]|uniref:lipocalin family protein n=1 Tax=Aquimarina sp. ERC-38 TaxID=2949996 RepID=UPI002245474E|nr:lipocalin family protein [Aquimarina sp. ERC-38]UZO79880.1 lipocalin family protein [Aquimarina sp. ERC-38]
MKKGFLILTIASLFLNIACSKDDDTEPSVTPEAKAAAESFIAGTWKMTGITYEGKPVDLECPDEQTIVFKEDNSGTYFFAEIDFDEQAQTCIVFETITGSVNWEVTEKDKIIISDADDKSETHELDLAMGDDTFILNFLEVDEFSNTVEVYERKFERQDEE